MSFSQLFYVSSCCFFCNTKCGASSANPFKVILLTRKMHEKMAFEKEMQHFPLFQTLPGRMNLLIAQTL